MCKVIKELEEMYIMCTGCLTMCEGRELMCKGFHMLHNCKNDSVMFYDKSKYYIGKRKENKGGCEMCKRIREKLFFIPRMMMCKVKRLQKYDERIRKEC